MIDCPKCSKKLVGPVDVCQFCGAKINLVSGGGSRGNTGMAMKPSGSAIARGGAKIILYIMATIYIIDAVILMLIGEKSGQAGPMFTFLGLIRLFIAVSLYSGWGWWLSKVFLWLAVAGGLIFTAILLMASEASGVHWLISTTITGVALWSGYKVHQ